MTPQEIMKSLIPGTTLQQEAISDKIKGTVIEISGTVEDITSDNVKLDCSLGDYYNSSSIILLNASFDKQFKPKLLTIGKGSILKIRIKLSRVSYNTYHHFSGEIVEVL